MGQDRPKMSHNLAQKGQDELNLSPRWTEIEPRWSQDGPRWDKMELSDGRPNLGQNGGQDSQTSKKYTLDVSDLCQGVGPPAADPYLHSFMIRVQ